MHNNIKKPGDFFHCYKQAAWEKNVTDMISLYDSNVVIFDMWGQGFINGLEQWSEEITAWLTSLNDEKVNVSFEMIEIQESEAVAFASALVQFQAIGVDGQIIRSMKNRITVGLKEKDGSWKVMHQHTSAPIDSNLTAVLEI